MTTVSANSTFFESGDGSINQETSKDTPNHDSAITEPSSPNSKTVTPEISNPNSATSASKINAAQISKVDCTLSEEESHSILESLQLIKDLDLFLMTAPVNWHENQVIRRYFLNKEEGFVSCVYWNNLYFITGTDIVRCIAYKMGHIGREIVDRKKFEEGIFSDLRALKCGTHAILENSRSPFLKFLHRNQCLRTQKKQKVFFWFSVPHNKLFTDVLERDLKKELTNQPATTKPISPIFKSFEFDQSLPLVDQLSTHCCKILGKDISHLLLKSNDVTQNLESDKATLDVGSGTETPTDKPTKLNSAAKVTNKNQIPDDFPLDFLDSSNELLGENYITSIQPIDSAKNNGQFYIDGQSVFDEQIRTPRKNSQIQSFEQFQSHSHGNLITSQFPDHFDGLLLNSKQLFSGTPYSQSFPQLPQPLFFLSNLPSAVEPANILATHSHGRNLSLSASMSQYLPTAPQNSQNLSSPSTFMMNNDNQLSFDPIYIAANNQANSKVYSKITRSASPMVPTNSGTSYMNIPSATLMPVSVPLQKSGDISSNTTTSKETQEHSSSSSGHEINESKETHNEEKNDVSAKQEILESKQQSIANNQSKPHQDYMMLMPSYNTANGLNFRIIGGQIFTPGNPDMEYSFDNYALSAGVGISPVIGFNNGLLSAIQYQPTKQLHHQNEKDNVEIDREDFDTQIDEEDEDNIETNELEKEKTLKSQHSRTPKGILLNNKQGKVTKMKTSTMRRKTSFLNPTLRHLEIDDAVEGNDEVYSDDDENNKESQGKC